MTTVIHRIDRGPFSGVVTLNTHGPFRGWYSYSWTVGDKCGGCNAVGREQAIAALNLALREYIAQSHEGVARLH